MAIFDEDEESGKTFLEAPGVFMFLAIFFEEDEGPAEMVLSAKDAAAEVVLFSMVSQLDWHVFLL